MCLSWVLSSEIEILIYVAVSADSFRETWTVLHITSYRPLWKIHTSIYKREYELINNF